MSASQKERYKQEPYQCPICGKEFKSQGTHLFTHTEGGFVPWSKGGGHYRPESLAKMSASQKARFKREPTPNKGMPMTAAQKLKLRLSHLGKSHQHSDAAKQKMSEATKGIPKSPHMREILRQNNREILADPVRAQRRLELAMAGCKRRPTSIEKMFIGLCAKHGLPYRFVGDGQVWINRANPDFINTNGKKQLVEILGRYWHTEEETAKRVAHYKRYGFECITIWEEELKNEDAILRKIGAANELEEVKNG
jgi:very-short-patch-repair endonuclease